MAHKLPRLSKSILDKPQLITPAKFKEIADVLENRGEYLKSYEKSANSFFSDDDDDEELEIDEDYGDPSIGVLRVEGPTTYKPTGWEAYCGGCSYTSLLSQMGDFIEQGKKIVLMKIDSPGGQAYRMMFTAKELRRLADENGIKLIAYVDGMAASAGMGLACAAHEIIANPESELGSIGVVVSLLDTSEAEKKEGYKRIYVTAGEEKVPYKEDGSFKETFLSDIQADVDDLYDKFVEHVAVMRGIDQLVVRNTQAKLIKASLSVELGLADRVMEETEFLTYLLGKIPADSEDNSEKTYISSFLPNTKQSIQTTSKENLMSQIDKKEASVVDVEMATKFAEMQAAMDTQALQLKASMDALASYQAKEQEDAKSSLSIKLDGIPFLTECKEDLMSFFMSTDSNKQVKSLMSNVIDKASMAHSILSQEMTTKLEEASKAKLDAEAVAEKAKLDAQSVTKQFGEKKESSSATPVLDPVNREASIADWVSKAKTK